MSATASAELSRSYEERSRLSLSRQFWGNIGLILLSLALPGEDVHLIAEGLGRSAALRQTPVYVMEGNAQESDTRAVLEAQLDRLVFTEGGTGELLARTARREGPTAAPR